MKPDQLSQTATFIAIKLYGLTQMQAYRSMFDQETISFYDRLVADLPPPFRWYHPALKHSWLRKFFIFGEELLLPGDLMHIIVRKWQIQKFVEKYLKDGYEQLLILGSGFDHLAAKYSRKGIRSIEIDAPGMIAMKEKFLKKYGYTNKNLNCQAIYVSDEKNTNSVSNISQLNPDMETIIVAEGFFDYLSPDQTHEQLNDLDSYFNRSSVLINTVFSLEELSTFRALVFKSSVWMVGERLRLEKNLEEFSRTLNNSGYKIIKHLDTVELHDKLMEVVDTYLPLLQGFHLLITHNNK